MPTRRVVDRVDATRALDEDLLKRAPSIPLAMLSNNTIQAGKPAGLSPRSADDSELRAVYGTNTSARLIGNTIDGGRALRDLGLARQQFAQ